MSRLGAVSQQRLDTCHPRLKLLVEEVSRRVPPELDFTVLCGYRGEREQAEAVAAGRSTKAWPTSQHNSAPSHAVDLAPYPIDWTDDARFAVLAGFVLATAVELGIKIRWGGDWNQNGRTRDERLKDFPHFELRAEEYASKLAA